MPERIPLRYIQFHQAICLKIAQLRYQALTVQYCLHLDYIKNVLIFLVSCNYDWQKLSLACLDSRIPKAADAVCILLLSDGQA